MPCSRKKKASSSSSSTMRRTAVYVLSRRECQVVSILLLLSWTIDAGRPSYNKAIFRLPGRRGFPVDDDDDSEDVQYSNENDQIRSSSREPWRWIGTGREFPLFDTRGGNHINHNNEFYATHNSDAFSSDDGLSLQDTIPVNVQDNNSNKNDHPKLPRPSQNSYSFPQVTQRHSTDTKATITPSSSSSSSSRAHYYRRRRSRQATPKTFFQPVTDWWEQNVTPNIKSWPKIQCRVEPTTTLKIRKTFRPLKTIVRLGADFNTQLGVWQFKSSWEDAIIGGKLTLIAGRELQLTKSWQLSVGGVDDLVTRLRFRAAVDLQTLKAYARVGFRTERLSPINVMEGFTIMKRLPLDGNKGHVKLEVKANLALPEPEIEYSTETQRSLIGMGDIQVNLEELNLVLDY